MRFFDLQARFTSRRPVVALVGLLLVTVLLGAGAGLTEAAGDQVDAFLPEDNPAAQAEATISERFAGASVGSPIQLIVRGDVLTPDALQAMLDAAEAITTDPAVEPLLAPEGTVQTYAHALQAMSPDRALGELSQAEIDALVESAPPAVAGALDQLVARNIDGQVVGGLGIVQLADAPFAEVEAAELAAQAAIDDLATGDVEIRTFSNAKLNEEINESQGSTTALLLGLALVVIFALLVVFYRTGSDVALSVVGLVATVIWVFGIQGWLGPGGLDVIGASNPLATMVPVLLIGLTVDFALQLTGRYRELVNAGEPTQEAVAHSVRSTGLPLLLAAGTTVISFFTNITNSLPPLRDFGIIAGLGVLGGYLVMTTLVPAARGLLDGRRIAKGKRIQSRLLADAIPGVGSATAAVARGVVAHPRPIMLGIGIVTVVAGIAASNIDTTFSNTDFLPEDTEAYEDIVFLDERFGGGSTSTNVLVTGDATDAALIAEVVAFEQALADEATRPDGVSGAPTASVYALVTDLSTDDGPLDERYDAEFAAFVESVDLETSGTDTYVELYERLQQADPDGLARVLSLGEGDQPDAAVIRIPTVSGSAEEIRTLVDDLETLWHGPADTIQLPGADILEVSITDEMIDSQVQSIALTVLAALVILALFFGITERRPVLGVLTVLPIGLVVVSVLGTMVLLGISYNVLTALITALTIGVGVDYTIHITHRFLEELEEHRGESMPQAMTNVLQTTGAALIGSALTTALGFAVLLFSPLAPMQQFGLLTAVTIVYSLIAAFVVLPPMLVLWARYHDRRGDLHHDDEPTTDQPDLDPETELQPA